MKKLFSWVVVAFLTVMAFIVPTFAPKAIAGEGNGRNEKIESIDDAGLLLKTFNNRFNVDAEIEPQALSFAGEGTEIIPKYSSATVRLEGFAGYSVKDQETGISYYSYKMKRDLTYYFTGKATYISVEADMYFKTKEGSPSSSISILADLYINYESSVSYMKIKRMMVRNPSVEFPKEALNKWIDIGTYYSLFEGIIEKNVGTLNCFGEVINKQEEGDFSQDRDVYKANKDLSKRMTLRLFDLMGGGVNEGDIKESSFTVDLSSRTSPHYAFSYSLKHKETTQIEGRDKKIKLSAGENIDLFISNINNTVINFPNNVEVYQMNEFEG